MTSVPPRAWPTEDPYACPMAGALRQVSGKWKPMLLHMLAFGPQRFGELRKGLPTVRHKVLTEQLRALESDGLVVRIDHHQVPPHVEYRLSEAGKALGPILEQLYHWGVQHLPPADVQRDAEVATS